MRPEIDLQAPLAPDAFRSARHFARYMLQGNRLALAPQRGLIWTPPGHQDVGDQKAMTSILFCNGCWQVELLMISPGASSPLHRHNHCESADVLLNGDLSGTVGGRPFGTPRGGDLVSNIQTLPIGVWHGGGTETGLVALSFQRWVGMAPTFIANDWEPYDHPE